MKRFTQFCTMLFIIFLTSCGGDSCEEINCGPNGMCQDGECQCEEGYEGTSCETELREKFLGDWIANDYGCSGLSGATIEFSLIKGATINDLLFTEFVSGIEFPSTFENNIVTIPLKEYGTTSLMGILRLNEEGLLEIEFIIDNSIAILECTATAHRK